MTNCKDCKYMIAGYCERSVTEECPQEKEKKKLACFGLYDYCSNFNRNNCKDQNECFKRFKEWSDDGVPPNTILDKGKKNSVPKGSTSMEVKAEFKYNPIGSFKHSNPFCIAFVYPSKRKSFILKGGIKDIEMWLSTFKEPAIIHRTFWFHRVCRVSIEVINTTVPIMIADKEWYKELWESAKVDKKKNVALVADYKEVIVAMKRLPRKWIKELNPYIPKSYIKDKPEVYKKCEPKNQDLRMIRLSDKEE